MKNAMSQKIETVGTADPGAMNQMVPVPQANYGGGGGIIALSEKGKASKNLVTKAGRSIDKGVGTSKNVLRVGKQRIGQMMLEENQKVAARTVEGAEYIPFLSDEGKQWIKDSAYNMANFHPLAHYLAETKGKSAIAVINGAPEGSALYNDASRYIAAENANTLAITGGSGKRRKVTPVIEAGPQYPAIMPDYSGGEVVPYEGENPTQVPLPMDTDDWEDID